MSHLQYDSSMSIDEGFFSLYYPMNHMTEIIAVEEFKFVISIFKRHLLKSSLVTLKLFRTDIFFFEPQLEDRRISLGPHSTVPQVKRNTHFIFG